MLNDFIHIREKIKEPIILDNEITGKLLFTKNLKHSLIILLQNDCIDEFVKTEGGNKEIRELENGNRIELTLFPLKIKNAYYFETFENLLQLFSQSYPDRVYNTSTNSDH